MRNMFLKLFVFTGVDVDPAEWSALPWDWNHRQRDVEEIWEILEEDDLVVFAEGPRKKVPSSAAMILLGHVIKIQYFSKVWGW